QHPLPSSGSRQLLCMLLFFFFTSVSYARQSDSITADIAKFRFDDYFGPRCLFATSSQGAVPEKEIPLLHFQPGRIDHAHPRSPADSLMEKDNYLRFILYNSSDTIKEVCFLPGFYCRDIRLFKASPDDPVGSFHPLPDDIIRDRRYDGVKRIKL